MKLKIASLLVFITISLPSQIMAQENASNLLEKAIAQAKAENKKVFIKYGASWCGWCKKMDKQMKTKKTKILFEDNYVIVNLVVKESRGKTHLENPEGMDYLIQHQGEKSGLPFWVILDDTGKMIQNSFNPKGQNLGCPATKKEVKDFIVILKNTSNLSDKDLAVISDVFLK